MQHMKQGAAMILRLGFLIGLCLTLMACESRLNPLNWFGGAERQDVAAEEQADTPTDPRLLVAEVTDLRVESLPSGALITATGLPTRQGYWQAELVEVSREDGRITYEFRIFPPPGDTPQGNPASRQVITATDLSVQDLASIREIVVQGAGNRLVSRR